MKPFELMIRPLEPFLPPLYSMVRRRLVKIARTHYPHPPDILDVGGRKSHYTVGLPANITITDLPREKELQQELNLGINQKIIEQTLARRSNVRQMLFDDMTHSLLANDSFDCVVAVEVLEHVAEDALFVEQVRRVLRPGGVFLMTTPNGDFVKNTNPDHKRHYTRQQLRVLLATYFSNVEVEYAIQGGTFRTLGLRPFSLKHPGRTVLSMTSNLVNSVQSARETLKHTAHGTRHLIAIATK